MHSGAYSENTVLANLCEGLMRMTPDFGYEPALASAVDHPDPRTWTYTIRDGVRFTDGRPLTAGDVVFSLRRNLDPGQASFWSTWFANVAGIDATGPRTVTVRLRAPDALFNQYMATAAGTVAERRYVERAGARYGTPQGGVMCTGPFALKRWRPGARIETVRNEDWWDTAQRPRVSRLDYVFVTNPSTLADALSTGEVDGTYEVPISAVPRLRSSDAGRLYLGRSLEFSDLLFTARPGPGQRREVREALARALDRRAIAGTIFHGTARPIRNEAFPATWGYGRDVYAAAYDRLAPVERPDAAAARELVASDPPARPLVALVNADDPAATELGVYVQSVGKAIGVPIALRRLPAAQQIAVFFDPERQQDYDLLISNVNYHDVADPVSLAVLSLLPGGPFNASRTDDPAVTAAVLRARAADDPAARARIMAGVLTGSNQDWRSVELVNYASRLFLGRRVTGAPASMPAYLYSPWGARLGSARP